MHRLALLIDYKPDEVMVKNAEAVFGADEHQAI